VAGNNNTPQAGSCVLGRLPSDGLRQTLLDILDQAMAVGRARCGSLQVYNRGLRALQLLAQRGMPADVAESFRLVQPDEGTVCARAWRTGTRVSVPSVQTDAQFAPYLPAAERCGFRAVQSTVIMGQREPLGVMSTHFAVPYYPSLVESVLLDACASRAARTIEEFAAAA
jgi:GAF domain-containing protein